MNTDFEEFVDEKVNKSDPITWSRRKTTFLECVDSLFKDIESWLLPLTKSNKITIDRTATTEINEDHIGRYKAPVLSIEIGSARIKLKPVGALIIASRGRIDVLGDNAQAMFVLNHKDFKSLGNGSIASPSTKKSSEGKAKDSHEGMDSEEEPVATDLEWFYAQKARGFEYLPLSKELFEKILMAVS